MTQDPHDTAAGADEEEARFPPGTRFGAYEVVRALGAGAFGSVYEVTRMPLGNRFALKVLHPELAASPKIVARFMREAEATARIRHPHVVSTFEVGVVERVPFLAMAFLEGETLRARMRREGPLPLSTVADVMVPVCSAVATVHAHGLVHRDLKPDNIMLTEPRPGALHPIVLDFGVARALTPDGAHLTTASRLLGTPLYMSPEQLMSPESVDARSDQWALGVILYACLSGELPFSGTALPELLVKIATTTPAPLASRVAGLPPAVDALVTRALQRDPSARFASVRELGAALLPFASLPVRASWEVEFAAHRPSEAPPLAPHEAAHPRGPAGLRVAAAVSMVAGVAAIAVAATVALHPRATRTSPGAATTAPDAADVRAAAPDAATAMRVAPDVVSAHVLSPPSPDAAVALAAEPSRVTPRVRAPAPARAPRRASPDAATVVVGANGAVMR